MVAEVGVERRRRADADVFATGCLETEVCLDLGINDMTSLWFCQRSQHEYRFIDYEEFNGEGLQYLADFLEKKNYVLMLFGY